MSEAEAPQEPTQEQPHPVAPVKRPPWRPTDYKPEYCEQVKTYCAQGFSLTAFAGEIEVARSTIGTWMEVHPDFRIACKIALNKRAAFLEQGMFDKDATGPMVTARRFGLVNANLKDEPKDWSEKVSNEHTGLDGGPIKTLNTNIDITNMNPDALDALEKALLLIETPQDAEEE